MNVLIADGGTGGHIFPALAVADELKSRKEVEAVIMTGTPAGLEDEIIPRHGYELRLIRVGGLIGKSLLTRIKTIMQLPFAYWQSRAIVREVRPAVAIGFGAYPSGPMLIAAHRARVPILLVEPNAIPGFTNRLLLRVADRVAVAFPDSAGRFHGKAILTGVPVRRLQSTQKEEQKFTIGVVGGSQGARAINQTIMDALPELAALKDRIQIIHQTGKGDFERVQKRYQEVASFFEVVSFIHDVGQFYNRCHLLICRAGAITLAEITSVGKPAILVPLPTATHNHQEQNARRLAEAGAAKMILQSDFTPANLVKEIHDILEAPETIKKMAKAAKDMGKPEATKAVVDLALSLVKK